MSALNSLKLISAKKRAVAVPPSLVKQQGRVGQVVAQIAASDQQQPATEMTTLVE